MSLDSITYTRIVLNMATVSVLQNLTMDQIKKAFEKSKSETTIPKGVRLELITEEFYDMALDFARDNYVQEEPIAKALAIEWTEEYKNFWLDMLNMNLSLMLVDEKSNDIIAFRITKITCSDDKMDLNAIQGKSLKYSLEFAELYDKQADFFGHFGITEAFHFLGLSVNNKYTRRGYATVMFSAAINMIRHFGIDQVYIKGEGSSNYSKKVFEKFGFAALCETPFDEWVVDGISPIQNTGIHRSNIVYGLKVTQND